MLQTTIVEVDDPGGMATSGEVVLARMASPVTFKSSVVETTTGVPFVTRKVAPTRAAFRAILASDGGRRLTILDFLFVPPEMTHRLRIHAHFDKTG